MMVGRGFVAPQLIESVELAAPGKFNHNHWRPDLMAPILAIFRLATGTQGVLENIERQDLG